MSDPGAWVEWLQTAPLPIIVFVLAWVCWKLYNKIIQIQDERIDDTRRHAKELSENAATLKKVIEFVKGQGVV